MTFSIYCKENNVQIVGYRDETIARVEIDSLSIDIWRKGSGLMLIYPFRQTSYIAEFGGRSGEFQPELAPAELE